MDLDKIWADPHDRRVFLARMTSAGLGVAAAAMLGPVALASGKPLLELVNIPDNGKFPGIPGRNESERVLNYALTLEFLEADLYRQALNTVAGKSLDTPLPDDVSGYQLSVDAGMSPRDAELGFVYLQQFAAVEAAHRDFLLGAIRAGGGTPVGPNPGGYHADFGPTLRSALEVIRTAEETGVRAYLGAAQFLTGLPLIQTAACIYSTEARHSAALNVVLGVDVGPVKHRLDSQAVFKEYGQNNFEYYQTPEQVLRAVRPFLA